MKKNLKIISLITLIGIALLLILSSFFKYKIESKINKEFKNYKFSKETFLNGMETDFDNLSCSGFIFYDCSLSNFRLETNINNQKIIAIESAETKLTSVNIIKPYYFNLEINHIELGKELKDSLFFNYDTKDYKEIGEKLYFFIKDSSIKINVEINKYTNIDYDGSIAVSLKNNLLDFSSLTNLTLKNQEYKEELTFKNPENNEEEFKSVLPAPFYMKVNKFNYTLKNEEFLSFFYQVYKLNALNIQNEEEKLLQLNYYYLGTEKTTVLTEKEFIEAFKEMFSQYINKIPDDEKTFKDLLKTLKKLYNKEINGVNVSGVNKNNVSVLKSGLFVLFDNLDTSKRYLDESFDIKFEYIEKK